MKNRELIQEASIAAHKLGVDLDNYYTSGETKKGKAKEIIESVSHLVAHITALNNLKVIDFEASEDYMEEAHDKMATYLIEKYEN